MCRYLRTIFRSMLVRRQEVLILYFDRASEFLQATSECMAVPEEGCTMQQLLDRLRKRGERWAYELDANHMDFTLNGRHVISSAQIRPGMEIAIHSRKSIFEP